MCTRVLCICSLQLALRLSFVLPTMASASTSKRAHSARTSKLLSDAEEVYDELTNCNVEAIVGSLPNDTAYAVRLARDEAILKQQFDNDRALAAIIQDNTDSLSSSGSIPSVRTIRREWFLPRIRPNMEYVYDSQF